jgi:outer membrane protein TolC
MRGLSSWARSAGRFGATTAIAALLASSAGTLAAQTVADYYDTIDVGALLKEAMAADRPGARALFKDKQISEVTVEGVIEAALGQNLDILIAGTNRGAAEADLDRAEANFDTILDVSIDYTRQRAHDRAEIIVRPRDIVTDQRSDERTETCINVEGDAQQGVIISGDNTQAQADCVFNLNTQPILEFASFGTKPSSIPQSVTGFIGLTQPFFFGDTAQASVGLTSRWNKKNSFRTDLTGFALRTIEQPNPFGFGSRMPWTSNVAFSFTTPFPFAKGFGRQGNPRSVDITVSEATLRRRVLEEKSARNAILENIIRVYWALVQNYERVRIFVGHRRTLEDIQARVQRLFDLRRATQYDLDQVQADVANTSNLEEIAWNDYLATSNALLELIDRDLEEVLVPVDFEVALEQAVPVDPEAAYDTALQNNPDIGSFKEGVFIADTDLKFAENQTKPDVDLIFTASASQDDSAFGYESLVDTISHIHEPDRTDFFIGLRYTVPFLNDEVEAIARRRRIEKRQSQDQLSAVRNQVTQQVSTAVNDTLSFTEQVEQAKRDLELALFAYNKALELQERGLTTQFEILRRFDDVLSARLALIAAQARVRIANAQLLSAQGVLDERYGG